MLTLCREYGADFMLLHLPSDTALDDPSYRDRGD